MHPLFHPLFVDYCSHFNGNHDYFECHEVLEEYWKEISPNDKKHPLVGYIQLATGMYHWRRQNVKGALRILTKAFSNFQANKDSKFFEYVDFNHLCDHCLKSIEKVKTDCPFEEFQLRIINHQLHCMIDNRINELPKESYHFLLNKHMLRDRSDILSARELKRNMNKLPKNRFK
jgi:uncharacterized protein